MEGASALQTLVGAFEVFSCEDFGGGSARNQFPGQQQNIRAQSSSQINFMQNDQDGLPFGVPPFHQVNEVQCRARIEVAEGFVQQKNGGSLSREASKASSLDLPARKHIEIAFLHAFKVNLCDGPVNRFTISRVQALENSALCNSSQSDKITNANWKLQIKSGLLREVADLTSRDLLQSNFTFARGEQSRDSTKKSAFAGAVRADHGGEASGLNHAIEMMDSGTAVVSQSEISEFNHAGPLAHQTMTQRTTTNTKPTPRRWEALHKIRLVVGRWDRTIVVS